MKKSKILILFLILLFIPTSVFASSVNIDTLKSNVFIEKNGNYNINENFKFTGSDNNNGIYRNIFYANSKGVDNLKIYSEDREFKKVDSAKKGDSYVYTIDDSGKELKIKAYIPWNKNINMEFKYTLKDAAIVGKDTGIFSYNFISKSDDNINKLIGEVTLPGFDFNKKLEISAPNYDYSIKNNTLRVVSENLKDNDYVSVNAEIPMALIPDATNKHDVTFDDIVAYSDDLNLPQLNPLFLIPEIIIVAASYIFYRKNNKEMSKGQTLGKIMPLTPAQASSFLFGNNQSSNFIIATILNFVNEGYFTVNAEEYKNKKEKTKVNYIFTRTDKDFENIAQSDRNLINNILLNGKNSFSTKELNQIRNSDTNDYNQNFYKYIQIINNELIEKGLRSKSIKFTIIGLIPFLLSILFIVLGIIEAVFNLYYGLIGIFLAVILFIIAIKIIGLQTALAREQRNYYYELYKNLKENDKINECSEKEKETLLIYSIAFGLNYDHINKLREEFSIDAESFIPIYWMIFAGGSTLTKAMNKSLVGSESGVSFGGGFIGGSVGTGTTGGGSAGGF